MQRIILKSKIHRITVTDKDINYDGSIEIDGDILKQADIYEGELVQVVNLNTGDRFETYTINGKPGSHICALNGGAARKGEIGDILLVISYCLVDLNKLSTHKPVILLMDKGNEVKGKK
ncbi:aspartate 1-decarboxylase [candidate division WOR-3 bacterium]|nr:aspartate 1-decarboxylase [candidate division WOR-3 bacterium]